MYEDKLFFKICSEYIDILKQKNKLLHWTWGMAKAVYLLYGYRVVLQEVLKRNSDIAEMRNVFFALKFYSDFFTTSIETQENDKL